MPYALCPMPYALCPMPYAVRVPYLSLERLYIILAEQELISVLKIPQLIPCRKNVATIKLLGGVKRRVISFTQSVRCVAIRFSLFFRDCRWRHTLHILLH